MLSWSREAHRCRLGQLTRPPPLARPQSARRSARTWAWGRYCSPPSLCRTTSPLTHTPRSNTSKQELILLPCHPGEFRAGIPSCTLILGWASGVLLQSRRAHPVIRRSIATDSSSAWGFSIICQVCPTPLCPRNICSSQPAPLLRSSPSNPSTISFSLFSHRLSSPPSPPP